MHPIPRHIDLGRRELVLLVAALIGLSAIPLDIMLPALPAIGHAMGATSPNLPQLAIGIFLLGAAISAFLVGPVADTYGRRRPILAGLCLFVIASLLTPLAPNFEALLALRLLQGLGVGATRLSQAVLRDRYAGSDMAEAMSLSLMVFLILPVIAPLLGQGILLVAGWQAIFLVSAALGALVFFWAALRLPETLAPENRRQLSMRDVGRGLRTITQDRNAVGYGLAAMLLLGSLYGLLSSVQQVYGEAYGLGDLFPLAMAGTAIVQSASAFICSRVIRRIGAPRVAAVSLWAHSGLATVLVLAFTLHLLPFSVFIILVTVMMAMFTWADATLGALSMTNLGHVAGTAASAFGAIQALGATLIGALIGQGYDGTPRALLWGALILSVGSVSLIRWARGPRSPA